MVSLEVDAVDEKTGHLIERWVLGHEADHSGRVSDASVGDAHLWFGVSSKGRRVGWRCGWCVFLCLVNHKEGGKREEKRQRGRPWTQQTTQKKEKKEKKNDGGRESLRPFLLGGDWRRANKRFRSLALRSLISAFRSSISLSPFRPSVLDQPSPTQQSKSQRKEGKNLHLATRLA